MQKLIYSIKFMSKQLTDQSYVVIEKLSPVIIAVNAERHFGSRAKPLIPVYCFLISRFGISICIKMSYPCSISSITVSGRLYQSDLSQDIFPDNILSLLKYNTLWHLVTELVNDVIILYCIVDFEHLFFRVCRCFLTIYMFSGFGSSHSDRSMIMVRCSYHYSIDVLIIQHLLVRMITPYGQIRNLCSSCPYFIIYGSKSAFGMQIKHITDTCYHYVKILQQ